MKLNQNTMYKDCPNCHHEMIYIKTSEGGYWKCSHCGNIIIEL